MNSQSAQILPLAIKAEAIKTEVIGMQAHDSSSTEHYTEQAYLYCRHRVRED